MLYGFSGWLVLKRLRARTLFLHILLRSTISLASANSSLFIFGLTHIPKLSGHKRIPKVSVGSKMNLVCVNKDGMVDAVTGFLHKPYQPYPKY